MEEAKTKVDEVKEGTRDLLTHVTDFLETYYNLTVVNLAQKGVNIASAVVNSILLCFIAVLFFAFLGVGVAWWLGDVINSRAGGFFIMAGFYMLVILGLIFMRKKMIFPFLRNMITKKIYE